MVTRGIDVYEWNLCMENSSNSMENYSKLSNSIFIGGWWFGTMDFYDLPYIGNVIIPTDEVHHFSEG